MASCTTSKWATAAPQIKLTVTQSASTDTTATLSWTLQYIASSAAQTNGKGRSYSVKIGGTTVKSDAYNINGKKGTYTIASGTKTINKTTATQSISFSCSMAFNVTWSGTYGGTKSASGSISVSAKTSYTVTFNANGGSGAPGKQTKWHGTTLTLSSTKPTRTGYSFLGWSTSSSATSATWSAGGSYTANDSDTLYAVWKANTYTVSFNANGGSGAPGNQTKTYGKTLTLSSTKPTRTNYTFKGWGTSASSTTAAYQPGGSYTMNVSDVLYAIWTLNYKKPRITSLSISRSDASGTVDESGTCALVKFNWACDKDVSAIKIEWKASADTTWANSTTITATGKSGSVTQTVGSELISTETTYDVRVTVTDGGGSTSSSKSLSSTIFIIDFLSGSGKGSGFKGGVAIGKASETDGLFDIGYKSRYRDDVTFDPSKKIYGIMPDGTVVSSFEPCNLNGNVVIGNGGYQNKNGNTNIYGNEIYLAISNVAIDGAGWRPYFRQGESFTMTFRTTGYITNSAKNLLFMVPVSKPIVGSPTITVTSGSGFILRQGGKYTHGSSADISITPTSYSAVISNHATAIQITATFSNTTNATNNDAIGIYWNGTITFS